MNLTHRTIGHANVNRDHCFAVLTRQHFALGRQIRQQLAIAWMRRVKSGEVGNATISDADDDKASTVSKAAVFRMAAIIVIGFVYIWLFSATGYLIATAITMPSLLVVFGTRNAGKVAVLTIGGTAAYYIVFIWLMGVYDPPG